MKFRKKPVVIEAINVGRHLDLQEIFDFVGSHDHLEVTYDPHQIFIVTLEGNMKVCPNDYIIRGVQGEFYPCKPDIFEATYEKVEE